MLHPKKLSILFFVLVISTTKSAGQNCTNWLFNAANPAYASMGQINVAGNKITVEAVFNRTAPYSGGLLFAGDLVSKHNTPSDANYLLRPNNAEITTSNGYFRTPDICEIELNKTYHVAMTYDGATLKFYRNGYLMSQVAATGNLFQNNWNTRIGWYEPQGFNTNFIGYINEVRIWNIVKTQTAIKANMFTSLSNPSSQTGLLAYYTFDNLLNKQGNSAYDGKLGGNASINQTNTNCIFNVDSCNVKLINEGIGGIINTYTPVINLDPCQNKIIVEDASTFNIGDTVLIIQMKGAFADTSNSVSFGAIQDYRSAGNYEFNYVENKTGNTITLKNYLTRPYEVPKGKVQLIRVPYYHKVLISSTLTCLPWDGSKGGVLVLNVKDSIIMSANVDVSGNGFKGGASPNTGITSLFCFTDSYFAQNGDLATAAKGESIISLGNNKAWGKGAPTNGGGGGLGHNSGGGGGSNGGKGGLGGYQLLTCGNAPYDNRGIGGYPLSYNNTMNKIFLGGGGGSGHVDNAGGSNMEGGNGGGIAFIMAPVIKSNGYKIYAKGGNATQCNAASFTNCHDGSGGGGGGGAVLFKTNLFMDLTEIQVSGGKGANLAIYNPSAGADKIGPGGGGGAGITWFNTPALPNNVAVDKNGGANGTIIQNNSDAWGAIPGDSGLVILNLKIPVDTIAYKKLDSVKITHIANSCYSFILNGVVYPGNTIVSNWNWDFGDGLTDSIQNPLHPYDSTGIHNVKLVVAQPSGCKDSTQISLQTFSLAPDAGDDTTICSNDTVSVILKGKGGSSYSWSPAAFLSDNYSQVTTATVSSSTTFYLDISDANGCHSSDSVVLTINRIPLLKVNTDTSFCSGDSVQLSASGADRYSWIPANGLSNTSISNPISAPATTTQYIITGVNNSGCTASDTVNVIVKPIPVITKSADATICHNTTVPLVAGGGVSYQWAPAATLNNASVANPFASPLTNTSYIVQVTGANGCSKTDSIVIRIHPLPVFTISSDKTTCTNKFVTLLAGGGTSYLWSPASFLNNPNSNNPASTTNNTTTFSVKIKDNTCNDSTTLTTVITVVPPPLVKAFKANDIDCVLGSAQLNASGANTYTWSPSTGLNNASIVNPLATVSTAQQYFVTGTDTTTTCTGTDSITVLIKDPFDPTFFVPSAFSPNGDGLNDCFKVKHFGTVKSVDIRIYNRLGNLVFHSTNVNACWDGTYKGSPADADNYVYYIKTLNDCGSNTRKGNLILLR